MPSLTSHNPADTLAIHNTLSLYCIALDTQSLALLSRVFTPTVWASYPFSSEPFEGVDAVRNAIQNRLGPIQTHHALSTQIITFSSPGTARAESHFTATHLGQGPHAGKTLTAYGRYIDELVRGPFGEGGERGEVPGASGRWRIAKRTVVFLGRVGDEAIMKEF